MERQPTRRPDPEAAQPQDPRVEAALKLLDEGVTNVMDSEQFRQFLEFSASFHNYSPNNRMLIWMQKPEATMVAGKGDWWKKHGRWLKKGEFHKPIGIFAPMIRKVEDPESGEIIEKLTGYRVVRVYDVSQTDGSKPLPERVRGRFLMSESETGRDLYDRQLDWLATQGVPVFRSPPKSSETASGAYDWINRKIYVHPRLSIDMAAKTLAHEAAHFVSDHKWQTPPEERELIAEGAAFMVAHYAGLDTSAFSFGYIGNWCQDRELFKQKLGETQQVASTIIKGIEAQRKA